MRRIAAVLALLLAAACGGEIPSSDQPNNSLMNDAETTTVPSSGKTLKLGEFAEGKYIGRIRVSPLNVGDDDLGPWLEADIRMENSSTEPLGPAELAVICKGDKEPGDRISNEFDFLSEIPPKSFREGRASFITDGTDHTGEPGTMCKTPAFIQITPFSWEGDLDPQPKFAIPDSVIAELNAKIAK